MTLGQTLKEQYDNHTCSKDNCFICEQYKHYNSHIKGSISVNHQLKTPEPFLERVDNGVVGGVSLLWV